MSHPLFPPMKPPTPLLLFPPSPPVRHHAPIPPSPVDPARSSTLVSLPDLAALGHDAASSGRLDLVGSSPPFNRCWTPLLGTAAVFFMGSLSLHLLRHVSAPS
uniref:Uncharacterized protein n=1 Tax=Triticum urartu TaxID=4572 RepID=A0A8R7R7D0_TRIUA